MRTSKARLGVLGILLVAAAGGSWLATQVPSEAEEIPAVGRDAAAHAKPPTLPIPPPTNDRPSAEDEPVEVLELIDEIAVVEPPVPARPRLGPRLVPGDLDVVVDAGEPGDVSEGVARAQARVDTCVEEAMRHQDSLDGQVAVGWTIRDGRVAHATLTKNSTGSDILGRCMARTVRSLRFADPLVAEVSEQVWVVAPEPPAAGERRQ